MTQPLQLLYSPFPSLDAARTVAKLLVEEQLVACCNLLPVGESHYIWEGQPTVAQEIILLAKTTPALAGAATALIAAHHPYSCPAILALDATANADFAQWAFAQLKDFKNQHEGG